MPAILARPTDTRTPPDSVSWSSRIGPPLLVSARRRRPPKNSETPICAAGAARRGESLSGIFKRFFQERPELHSSQANSLGSCFILLPDSYSLTNTYVACDADEIIVRLSDQRERPANVIGADNLTNVSPLKIDEESLSAVKISDSETMKVASGCWLRRLCWSNGDSGHRRCSWTQSVQWATYTSFIQCDVVSTTGSSGGSPFNLIGEMVWYQLTDLQ